MRITNVTACHSETRLTSNAGEAKQYTVGYEADVPEGEDAQKWIQQLMERAIRAVRLLHGDAIHGVELTITADVAPF